LKRGALRHTPAGIPTIDILISHDSIQKEAGGQRRTRCDVEATAVGAIALEIERIRLNQSLQVSGFLARRSATNGRLTLRVVSVEAANGGNDS
jgi:primosomal replication protein N